ncbi:MAG: WavE lipopolysaccharide synthesis family protein, partial [Burkholderiales bacterium]
MIRDDQISIVVQGDIRANTHQSVAALRRQLPRAEIVLSTFKNQMAHLETSGLSLLVDKLCVSDDPGAMPPTVNSPTAPPNNINRMLVSTQAGLKQATRPYA